MALKRKKLLLLAPLAVGGVVFAVLGALNPTNVAATHADHPNARLRTRHYRCSLDAARAAVLEIIPTLNTYGGRWLVVSHEDNGVHNVVHAEVPVLVFTDDLVVTLKAIQDGVVLDVRSASRVGRSDLGENRRHILQLLAELDAKLPAF